MVRFAASAGKAHGQNRSEGKGEKQDRGQVEHANHHGTAGTAERIPRILYGALAAIRSTTIGEAFEQVIAQRLKKFLLREH